MRRANPHTTPCDQMKTGKPLTGALLARLKGQHVRVHLNLHNGCYVITHAGHVAAYTRAFHLKDARPRIGMGGYKRCHEEQVRNVHAYLEGELVSATPPRDRGAGWRSITYNCKTHGPCFYFENDEKCWNGSSEVRAWRMKEGDGERCIVLVRGAPAARKKNPREPNECRCSAPGGACSCGAVDKECQRVMAELGMKPEPFSVRRGNPGKGAASTERSPVEYAKGAKRIAVHFTGTIESVAAVVWALQQGRVDVGIVVDPLLAKAKVMGSYARALATAFDLPFFSDEKTLLAKWGTKGLVIVVPEMRGKVVVRDDPRYQGVVGVNPDFGPVDKAGLTDRYSDALRLLDIARIRPPPNYLIAPVLLTDQGLANAASLMGVDTFERAVASAAASAGTFPPELIIFSDGESREDNVAPW